MGGYEDIAIGIGVRSYGHVFVLRRERHLLQMVWQQLRLTGTTVRQLYLLIHTEQLRKSVQLGACILQ